MELTEFITARLDEDEAVARRAGDVPFMTKYPGALGTHRFNGDPEMRIIHANPARVLASVEAHRKIVEEHVVERDYYDRSLWNDKCATCRDVGGYPADSPCPTLRALASIWRDHPDYDPEWA